LSLVIGGIGLDDEYYHIAVTELQVYGYWGGEVQSLEVKELKHEAVLSSARSMKVKKV